MQEIVKNFTKKFSINSKSEGKVNKKLKISASLDLGGMLVEKVRIKMDYSLFFLYF